MYLFVRSWIEFKVFFSKKKEKKIWLVSKTLTTHVIIERDFPIILLRRQQVIKYSILQPGLDLATAALLLKDKGSERKLKVVHRLLLF